MSDTLFATDASAEAHNDEAVLVEVAGVEYALPPSTARAFVDDVADAVATVSDTEPEDAETEDTATEPEAPEPRVPDPGAEQVLTRSDDDRPKRITADEDTDTSETGPLAFEPGEEIGTHTANESQGNPYVYLGVDVVDALQERADTVAERVTVRETDDGAALVPGTSDEWPDYSIGASSITVGKPGCRVLGLHPDDEVRSVAGEDVVYLVPFVADNVEADDPLDAAADWTPEGGTADEEDLIELAAPDSGATRQCQNCGNEVSKRYVDVFAPDGIDQPRCCPNCEDLVRDGNGVRESRT